MLSAIRDSLRVESVVENQLTTDFSDVEVVELMDTTPITPLPSTSSASEMTPPPNQTKLEYETLFQNYLKTFKDRMTALNSSKTESEEWVKKLEAIYTKIESNNTSFLKSSQFGRYMRQFIKDLPELKSDNEVVRHHNDLMIELNRLTQKPEKKSAVKVKDRQKRVKGLTDALKSIQKQIFIAENEELDYESMTDKSVFTDLPKLYKKAEEVWIKREELLKRSTTTGRYMFKKYRCDATDYPEINKCVEKLFTNHLKKIKNKTVRGYVDESFTFIDVRKAILDEIRDKQLVVMNTDVMIQSIYETLMKEKRKRRQNDSEEVFLTYETLEDLKPETVVDESDPLLEIELAKNRKASDDRMNALFDKYANEDRSKNGETIHLDNGLSEWDSDIVNNNEEFESIDVKDGDLEEDNEEDDSEDEKSDENTNYANAPMTDFTATQPKEESKPIINPTLSPVANPIVSPVVNPPLSPVINPSLSPVVNPSFSPIVKDPTLSPTLKTDSEEKPKEKILEVITINDEDYPSDDDDIEILEIKCLD